VGAFDALETAEPPLNATFPDGGLVVMRTGRAATDDMLVLSANPHGPATGAHGHADVLAIDLTLDGRPVIADPGTGAYIGPLREAMRADRAHAVVLLDGQPLARPATPFRWARSPRCSIVRGDLASDGPSVVVEHDGYVRLDRPAHSRRWVLRRGRRWYIVDVVKAGGPHVLSLRFPLAAGLEAAPLGQDAVRLRSPGGCVGELRCSGNGAFALEHAVQSPEYGTALDTTCCRFDARIMGAGAVLTLVRGAAGGGPVLVTELDAEGCFAWRVVEDDAEEVVAVPHWDGAFRLQEVRSDGEAIWFRTERSDAATRPAGPGRVELRAGAGS
jgi:hypothetical protein